MCLFALQKKFMEKKTYKLVFYGLQGNSHRKIIP